MHRPGSIKILCVAFVFALQLGAAGLDLAPYGHVTLWHGLQKRTIPKLAKTSLASAVELAWDEERDIQQVRLVFSGPAVRAKSVEYWFHNWPYDPPKMPSMEDPLDDPWQGEWRKAEVHEDCRDQVCNYTFAPLTERENPRAKNLPGTVYRRALKIRVIFQQSQTLVRSIEAFSNTSERPLQLQVQLGGKEKSGTELAGWFSAYNGRLRSVQPAGFTQPDTFDPSTGRWRFRTDSKAKHFNLDLVAAKPGLPGSNDHTVVTAHVVRYSEGQNTQGTDASFSFDIEDLAHGPIDIPYFGARIVDPQSPGQPVAGKKTVRARIPLQPEQSFERASKEIPPLDPVHREWGGPLYMPLAVDSSWQKFAFELGGDIFLSKEGLRAKDFERKHFGWEGDRLTWSIRTGEPAAPPSNPVLHPLDGYLPIAVQSWKDGSITWTEEAFATLLTGPLSPYDPARNENTPAMLLVRLTAKNAGSSNTQAVVRLNTDDKAPLHVSGDRLLMNDSLRAVISGASGTLQTLPSGRSALKLSLAMPAHEEKSIVLKFPATTDLTPAQMQSVESLDYAAHRKRVEEYWRSLVERAARFSVPEQRFNNFLRATVAHIHITATKDPQTGLMMLPAASYVYDVYENESCYQLLLLDALGQNADAAAFLKPMLELQGSKNFPGAHAGSFSAVFHGVRISDSLDYTANGYGLDHGTVLWTLAQHYLYTRDKGWFQYAWPHMQRAIQWIEQQRASTKLHTADGKPVREYGLLPASKLEDNNDWANWFSINAFAWAGMHLTGEILTELNRPEAAAVRQEAAEYKSDLRRAVFRATTAAPVTRLQDGTYEPYVPAVPKRRFRLFGPNPMNYYARYGDPQLKPLLRLGADRDTLCGTVLLLILGVFEPNEPIANWILNDWEDNETLTSGMGMNIHGVTDDRLWFSQGGMVFQANLINPIPVYLKRHEIPAAIRNLYNDFTACFYPQADQFTEEFHQWVHASGPFYKSSDEARFVNRLRDLLVLEDKDTLWLAAGAPRRWLESKTGIRVSQAATYFGPVSYNMHASAKPRTIEAVVQLPSRNPAKHNWLVVRTPTHRIQSAKVNGRPWQHINRSLEAIDLGGTTGTMNVQVEY